MSVYYNENNPDAVRWLAYLIAERLIPDGVIDDRSITDVQPGDLAGFTQCHWFAGVGGWAQACNLAGWGSREIWTASCPCQGESVAGRRLGKDDPRHLWPDYFRLARARRPAFQCGEQVSRAAGTHWLDGVQSDLESEDYAFWATDIPACSIDAPHIRNRIYWIARLKRDNGLVDAQVNGRRKGQPQPEFRIGWPAAAQPDVPNGGLVNADGFGHQEDGTERTEFHAWRNTAACADVENDGLGDTDDARCQERQRETVLRTGRRQEGRAAGQPDGALRPDVGSWWADAVWLDCHDGKKRRSKPGLSLMAPSVPGRVAAWRGIGNAIVPPLAAEVLKAYLDIYPQ